MNQLPHLPYPPTPTVDIVQNFHGTAVPDPYHWLEDANSPETQAWVAAQNDLTRTYLASLPNRSQLQHRLTQLWNYPKYSTPYHKGGRYFFSKNDGLQNQAILYWQSGIEGDPQLLLDPNTLSQDGTTALTNEQVSPDGSLLAYGISHHGSDWQTVRVRQVETGCDLEDTIRWCKFAGIAWKPDNSGFFYNRYPTPGTVPAEDQYNYNRVYWHQLGSSQEADSLIYAHPDLKELSFSPFASEDDQYLLLYGWHGTLPENRLYYRPMGSNEPFIPLLDQMDAAYNYITNVGKRFYVHTNLNAPRGRIVAIDLDQPNPANWQEIVPEQAEAIAFVTAANRQLVVATIKDAHHQLKLFDLNGRFRRDIPLPALGSILNISSKFHDDFLFFSFHSFLTPPTIYRYNFPTNQLTLFRQPATTFDSNDFETYQRFYPSKDGTLIPMFMTHRKGLELDGNCPTLLYGYGGFNISQLPTFWVQFTAWLELGGVFVLANLRGGDEYGEEWHRAGTLAQKQNVFDDFISAAEWLIANHVTNPRRLAIHGRSNGGLLVAACMVQRPDLFGAVICGVPVIDMLRYHKFTIGRYWVGEYGNAEENPDHFEFLFRYSPLHNVKNGTLYPPILLVTADTDDRVVPAHAYKFAATLQNNHSLTTASPILLRVDIKAGHGPGKPTAMLIEEWADIYAFLITVLEIT